MITILPVLIPFLNLLLLIAAWPALVNSEESQGWRASVLSGFTAWYLFIWISTEGLSLFHLFTRGALLSLWLLFTLAVAALWYKKRSRNDHQLPGKILPTGREWFRALPLAVILTGTFITAAVAPPNNNDSLSYHVARIMHWIQNQSVDFYPTVISRQLFMTPLSEYAMAHLAALGQGDMFLALVQWISFGASLAGVSLISRRLGADRAGQWFSALFAATIPMAILQSSSTQNDLVAAFFAVALAERVIRAIQSDRIDWKQICWIGITAGLGTYAKSTFPAFAAPFLIWLGVHSLRRSGISHTFKLTTVVLILIFLINSPLWIRNYTNFETIFGPGDALSSHGGFYLQPRLYLSNLVKNTSFHFSPPPGLLNQLVKGVYVKFHELIRVDINATNLDLQRAKFSLQGFSMHEDYAGSLLHLLIPGLMILLLPWSWKKMSPFLRIFSAAWAGTYLLYCFLYPWQVWGSRLQLSIFILAAVFVEASLRMRAPWLRTAISAVLFLFSLVPLASNQTRPLYAVLPRPDYPRSIFTSSRSETLFANHPYLEPYYRWIENDTEHIPCKSYGIIIDSSDPEYYIWASLGAPFNGKTVTHLNASAVPYPAEITEDTCALICTTCSGQEEYLGMNLVEKRYEISLYLRPDDTPDP